MDAEQQLIECFTQLSNPQCPNTAEITESIEAFTKNPESLFLFLKIAGSNPNPLFRRRALVFSRQCLLPIDKLLRNTHEDIEQSQFSYLFPLKPQILEMLIHESADLQPAICDVIEVLASIVIQVSEWPELPQFAANLFSDPKYLSIALYLMKCIYDLFPDEDAAALLVPYSTIIVTSLISETPKIRLLAIDCLNDLLFTLQEEDDILKIPSLMEHLKTAAENAVQIGNEQECAQLFGLFETIFTERFDQFNTFLPTFCEFALTAINSTEISPSIKVSIHQIIDEAPRAIPEYFGEAEIYEKYLMASLRLSCEICASDRENVDYQFTNTFLSLLASNMEDIDGFYASMLQIIQSLIESQDLSMIQVSLFSLTSIVEYCTDPILEDPDFIVRLALQGLSSPDEIIPFEANELLSSIIGNASTCLTKYFDELVAFYTNKLNVPHFLPTFIALLKYSDRPPQDLKQLLMVLMAILGSEGGIDKHDYIKCLTASLSHASIDESYYSALAQPLLSLVSADNTLLADVFDCFGALLKTSPISMANDINSIMGLMFSGGQPLLDCAETLLTFVETLPIAMAPYNQHAINFCKAVLDKEIQEFIQDADIYDLSNNPEIMTLVHAHGASIKILAYLAPDEYYLHKLDSLLISYFTHEQFTAAESISICAHSLFQAKFDASPIFARLFEQIEPQELPQIFVAMIKAIDDLSSFYQEYVTANAQIYCKLILTTITSQSKCFHQLYSPAAVEEQVMPAIYLLFNHVVEILGVNFTQFLLNPLDQDSPNLQSTLFNLAQGKKRNIRGYATLILSHIAIAIQSPDILQLAMNSIRLNIKNNNINLRINLFNGLRYLLRYPQIFSQSELSQPILEAAHPLLLTLVKSFAENREAKDLMESTLALLARCIVSCQWTDLGVENICQLLSLLDVLSDFDNGKCFDFVELLAAFATNQQSFAAISEEALKFSIRVYTQDYWYFTHTPQNILDFAKNVLIQNGQLVESVFEKVGFNQRIQQTLLNRLG